MTVVPLKPDIRVNKIKKIRFHLTESGSRDIVVGVVTRT
jgi:hypothetical protein